MLSSMSFSPLFSCEARTPSSQYHAPTFSVTVILEWRYIELLTGVSGIGFLSRLDSGLGYCRVTVAVTVNAFRLAQYPDDGPGDHASAFRPDWFLPVRKPAVRDVHQFPGRNCCRWF